MSSRYASRLLLTSSTTVSAPIPEASFALLVPTVPPPRMTTLPRRTPGTPESSTPLPPCSFSSCTAPTCTAMRPATSLIGFRSGSCPSSVWMVSYATAATFRSRRALLSGLSAAR